MHGLTGSRKGAPRRLECPCFSAPAKPPFTSAWVQGRLHYAWSGQRRRRRVAGDDVAELRRKAKVSSAVTRLAGMSVSARSIGSSASAPHGVSSVAVTRHSSRPSRAQRPQSAGSRVTYNPQRPKAYTGMLRPSSAGSVRPLSSTRSSAESSLTSSRAESPTPAEVAFERLHWAIYDYEEVRPPRRQKPVNEGGGAPPALGRAATCPNESVTCALV